MSVRFNDLEALLTSARVLSIVMEGTTDWSLLTGGEMKTDNSREVRPRIGDRKRVMGDDQVNSASFS